MRTETKSSLRGTALPQEHGSWGMIGEPMLLGWLVAPSLGGFFAALLAMAVFLLRVPILWQARNGRNAGGSPRSRTVRKALAWYGGIALLSAAGAWLTADTNWWIPLLIAAPAGLAALLAQMRGESRQLFPELLAACALGGAAPAIAIAGGFPAWPAHVLWLLLILKNLSAILFVRHQLRRKHGRPSVAGPVIAAHAAGILITAGLAMMQATPWLSAAAFVMLAARAAYAMSRPVKSAKQVGWIEVAVSILMLAMLVTGYRVDQGNGFN